MRKYFLVVLLGAFWITSAFAAEPEPLPASEGRLAPKPLYRDPVYDGAADPSIIYDRAEKKWLMFYTNRRANVPDLTAVTWVHGTPIGIAASADGATWTYRGTVDFPKEIPNTADTPTFWAPALVYSEGTYHMFVTVVPGIFTDWQHPRNIVHVTSADLKKWKYEGTLPLVTDKVIDPCVLRLPDGTWRMWYNNERTGKTAYYADSPDLYRWTDKGSAHLPRDRGEAPLGFFWKGHYWLLIDLLGNIGLGAYRSDDALTWERQPAGLLDKPGAGKDDQNGGHHPEVVLSGDRAFLFYFVHPGVAADSDARDTKRSSIQVVELKYADGWLSCDRDAPTQIRLLPPTEKTAAVDVKAAPGAAPRLTQTIDGIAYDYAANDEPIVRELGRLVAAQRAAPSPPAAASTRAAAPLSVADFRLNRANYLKQIAGALGLEKPTALQEECYDGFLDNFERTDKLFSLMIERSRPFFELRAITVLHKADLLRRLKEGESIPGFTLDPDGEHVNFAWKPPEIQSHDERIAELFKQRENRRLDTGYNFSTAQDGTVDFSAYSKIGSKAVKPKAAETPPPVAAASEPTLPPALPLVITAEQENLSAPAVAAELAKFAASFTAFSKNLSASVTQNPVVLAQLLLHETTEIGIVERYIGSQDRRWLCEGMANYVAWKIARDRAGDAVARQIYDVQAQLAQYAAFRDKIDLRGWPTAEKQRPEDANTPRTKAHYAYAARAVFLMAERRGENFLPQLFQEVGKTPRAKTNMRTVEKAYQKLTREDLSRLLADALAPVPDTQPNKTDPGKKPAT